MCLFPDKNKISQRQNWLFLIPATSKNNLNSTDCYFYINIFVKISSLHWWSVQCSVVQCIALKYSAVNFSSVQGIPLDFTPEPSTKLYALNWFRQLLLFCKKNILWIMFKTWQKRTKIIKCYCKLLHSENKFNIYIYILIVLN